MKTPRVGLLPFYLEHYSRHFPQCFEKLQAFLANIKSELHQRRLEVELAPVCHIDKEFSQAVAAFASSGLDAIITLHLAYSPSLESIDALVQTDLPLIVLDTTPDFSFGPDAAIDAIMLNHGIHGVQDMCNLLGRHDRPFVIEVGHWEHSDVLDHVAAWARVAALCTTFRNARVGRIGQPFRGMGDFAVPAEQLRQSCGVQTISADPADLASFIQDTSASEIQALAKSLKARCTTGDISDTVLAGSVRAALAVQKWLAQEELSAFSVNFMADSPLPVVPFLAAALAMEQGLGYAGEGDVLTAALCGTLLSAFPDSTFSEMFCPDWKGNSIFLSHMGEANPRVLLPKPRLIERAVAFSDGGKSLVMAGAFKPGQAVWVNLAPAPENQFTLLLSPVEMLDCRDADAFQESVRGWMRPPLPVSDFLAEYSRNGGTHHAVLVYDADLDFLRKFAQLMGWRIATF